MKMVFGYFEKNANLMVLYLNYFKSILVILINYKNLNSFEDEQCKITIVCSMSFKNNHSITGYPKKH
jgi:hypothetical protein